MRLRAVLNVQPLIRSMPCCFRVEEIARLMQIRMSIDAPQVLLPYVPKCTWYFAPLEKRHAPAPRFGAVRAYSQLTYIPRAPAALAMPRCPAGIRPSPYTCLCTLPKPG